MFFQEEACPFNTALCIQYRSPPILYDFNLNIKPSCQTLSKAFETSRKIPLMSAGALQSKLLKISCVIDNNCTTQSHQV